MKKRLTLCLFLVSICMIMAACSTETHYVTSGELYDQMYGVEDDEEGIESRFIVVKNKNVAETVNQASEYLTQDIKDMLSSNIVENVETFSTEAYSVLKSLRDNMDYGQSNIAVADAICPAELSSDGSLAYVKLFTCETRNGVADYELKYSFERVEDGGNAYFTVSNLTLTRE